MKRAAGGWWLPVCLGGAMVLFGCERIVRNMYDQPKYNPMQASALWSDGASARPLVPGVLPHSAGVLALSSSGREGVPAPENLEPPVPARTLPGAPVGAAGEPTAAQRALVNPLPRTLAVLRRGQERFTIYCTPCHSVLGDGDGMVVRRGFPAPRSFDGQRLRNAPDGLFFDAITRGYGVMYPFADRIVPSDRWAIVHYIRALQLSQHAALQDVPEAERARLAQSEGR